MLFAVAVEVAEFEAEAYEVAEAEAEAGARPSHRRHLGDPQLVPAQRQYLHLYHQCLERLELRRLFHLTPFHCCPNRQNHWALAWQVCLPRFRQFLLFRHPCLPRLQSLLPFPQ